MAHSGFVVSFVLSVRPKEPHVRDPRPLAYTKQTGSEREKRSRSRSALRIDKRVMIRGRRKTSPFSREKCTACNSIWKVKHVLPRKDIVKF